jgi:hypothetical protein
MTWFDKIKDLLGVSVALLAVVLSLITTVMQRKERQRAAYREIYTVLMSEDLHRGRWIISKISSPDEIPVDGPEQLLVYRTLGVFDNLAMFVRHGVVPREWVLDVWHHPLRDMRTSADLIRDQHELNTGLRPWPELWSLFAQLDEYHSKLSCCVDQSRPPAAPPRRPDPP